MYHHSNQGLSEDDQQVADLSQLPSSSHETSERDRATMPAQQLDSNLRRTPKLRWGLIELRLMLGERDGGEHVNVALVCAAQSIEAPSCSSAVAGEGVEHGSRAIASPQEALGARSAVACYRQSPVVLDANGTAEKEGNPMQDDVTTVRPHSGCSSSIFPVSAASNTASFQFTSTTSAKGSSAVAVRVYWDADTVPFYKSIYTAFLSKLGCFRVRALDVFACPSTARGLCDVESIVERPPGGVLHMDIQSDATNTSRTDMRLAMHAMGAAAQDRETQFIVVSDKDDFLPLVRSLQEHKSDTKAGRQKTIVVMQNLGRQVVVVTQTHSRRAHTQCADAWIPLNAPSHKPRPSSTTEHVPEYARPVISTQQLQKCKAPHGCNSNAIVDVNKLFNNSIAREYTDGCELVTTAQRSSSRAEVPFSCTTTQNASTSENTSSQGFNAPASISSCPPEDNRLPEQGEEDSDAHDVSMSAAMPSDFDSILQQNCVSLGHHIEHCSSRIFNELKQKMKVEREFFDHSDMPAELLDKSAAGLKTMLTKGFLGQRGWSDKSKVSVVKLLLVYDRDVLLAQLGMLSQVPLGNAVNFPKRYEDTDPAVSSSYCLKKQGQQLLQDIIQVHTCGHSTPQHMHAVEHSFPTASEGQDCIKQRFKQLADCIERCSSRIFYELKGRLRSDNKFCDTSGIPNEVLTGSALKTVISEGLRGATGWNLKARVAVVRMLLGYDRAILLAQLGSLAQSIQAVLGGVQAAAGDTFQFPKLYAQTNPAVTNSLALKEKGRQLLQSIITLARKSIPTLPASTSHPHPNSPHAWNRNDTNPRSSNMSLSVSSCENFSTTQLLQESAAEFEGETGTGTSFNAAVTQDGHMHGTFDQRCMTLGECLSLCSGGVYMELREHAHNVASWVHRSSHKNGHKEAWSLLLGGKGMRKRLLSAFLGNTQWSRAGRASIATVLLQAGTDNLLAQLGFLTKLPLHPKAEPEPNALLAYTQSRLQKPPVARCAFPEPLHIVNPTLLTSPQHIQAGRTFLQAISLTSRSELQELNYNDLETADSEISQEHVENPGTSSHTMVPTEASECCEYGHTLEQFESQCVQLAQCIELCSESCFGVIRANHLADQIHPGQWVESFGGVELQQQSDHEMRSTVAAGFRDELTWEPSDKAAMAQVLLVDSHLDFWAQIGFLVKAPPGFVMPFPQDSSDVRDEVSSSELFQEQGRQFICSIANFSASCCR